MPTRSACCRLPAFCLALLLVDSLVFAQNHWHVTPLTAPILGWQTWAFGALYLAVFAALYAMVARTLWRRSAEPARRPLELRVGVLLVGALALSQVLHIWADVHYYVPITRLSHAMPLS